MNHYHPQKNDEGKLVELLSPSQPTPLSNWLATDRLASVVPAGPMPDAIGGIPVQSWSDAPSSVAGWEGLAASADFDEPAVTAKPGKSPASGVVTIDQDGRVWVVSPSNRHGGYTSTFPKGTIFPGDKISLRANALKEAYEESGLKVELIGFLADSDRTTTTTRYYLARRVGGNPADMGWESQAVHLVPQSQLAKFVSHKNDAVVIQALLNRS
jgi:ADP-ribose pyrophosphatase YjhB (NUDIX family)